MTRAEKASRRKLIKTLYSEGASADELAERFGLNKHYIYSIAGKKLHSQRTSINTLRASSEAVIELLNAGMSYKKIGEEFGVSKDVVSEFCKENGMQRGANANSEEDVARKINEKTGGQLEYVSGYTKKENPVRVRCTVCGGYFERTFHNLTTKGHVTCPYCVESNRKAKRIKQDQEKGKRKRKAQVNKIRNAKQLRMVVCEICGETFFTWDSRQKYCSISCRKESARRYAAYNHGSDDRLNKSNIVDRDIDLKELFKRDKGVCQICGGLCDYSDCYTNENGTFITGNAYPSKDHIIPLSMGGKHSWDNVRLAHRGCNSKYYWKNQRFVPSLGAESCGKP